MSKKIAVITGASSGIGDKLAKVLRDKDYIIINISMENSEVFEYFYACDISSKSMVEAVFGKIKEKFGRIDLLVNNAGFGQNGALELLTENEYRKNFDVNTLGLVWVTNAALPMMSEGSRIINNISMAGLLVAPWRALYCASKAAANMLSLGYRMELKHSKIDVVSVCPGDVKTPFTKNRQKNYTTNERYGDRMKVATEHQEATEHKRMKVEYVADEIAKIAMKKKTKPQYIIGRKYKMYYFLQRLLPLSWWLRAMNKRFNKK